MAAEALLRGGKRSRSVDWQWIGAASSAPSLGRNVQKRATLADISKLASAGLVRSPTEEDYKPHAATAGTRLPTSEEVAQERAFRKWLNARLEAAGYEPMANLATDLCSNGVTLLRLLEILSGEPLPTKWNHAPRMRIQKAENLDIALRWIRDTRGIRLTNIAAEDLLDSNLKLTLGLVWTLLFRLSFSNLASDGTDAKDSLLAWCQRICAETPYELECEDWTWSWQDGRVICALLHKHQRSSLDWDRVDQLNDEERIILAFDIAEKLYKVPRSLEVHDLCRSMRQKKPDEKLVITYVAGLYEAVRAAHITASNADRLVAFVDLVDSIMTAQEQYVSRAGELRHVLSDIRALWHREQAPAGYEEALRKLEGMAGPASRNRLRAERRELTSLYARVVSKMQTSGMAAWQLPEHLVPATITADVQLFLKEEDDRRQLFADYILRCQDRARALLAEASNVATLAIDRLSSRIDTLNTIPSNALLSSLHTCQNGLADITEHLHQLQSAERNAERVDAVDLHARLHTSDDLTAEKEGLEKLIKERMSLCQAQTKPSVLSATERERAIIYWRQYADTTDTCLEEEDFAALWETPELALTSEDAHTVYADLAGPNGVAFEAFLEVLQSLQEPGEGNIRRAISALSTSSGLLDLSKLPSQASRQLQKWANPDRGGIDGLLKRLYS